MTSSATLFAGLAAAAIGACALVACSASTTASSSSTTPDASATQPGDDDGSDAGADAAPPDLCAAAPSKSACSNEGSWVRGVAKFDPTHFKAGDKPVLRMALRHGFTLFKGEETIGGRLHSYDSLTPKDITTGEIPFAIDMCGLGTAMWSEENGTFNLILFLDENGNNDLDNATSQDDSVTLAVPDKGELVKMIPVDVSCHAASACVSLTLDCADGASCTTITPFTSCAKKSPSCTSDDAYCK